jgi:hypothetical protein
LQAERLAKSGHEVAAYLDSRAVGTNGEDLTGLPVKPLIPGLTYRIEFDAGTADITLEGENRKLDVAAADEDTTNAFFSAWTGDATKGGEIAASIADWIDPNNDARPLGAEAAWYLSRGYEPRNTGLGSADLFLVKGIRTDDLAPAIIESKDSPAVRSALSWFIAEVPAGGRVNPNYASRTVLAALPGMTPKIMDVIIEARQHAIFSTSDDFRNRTGVSVDSPLLARLAFDRGSAPAVLVVARLHDSTSVRTERRVRRRTATNRYVALIERNVPPE